jgi:peptidoglycan/LPS O-acetylase OafA/YrhL
MQSASSSSWEYGPITLFRAIGKISYGLYAYHILALRTGYYLTSGYHHAFRLTGASILALLIMFVMAIASYKWLESPFLRLKQKKFTYVPSGLPIESGQLVSPEDATAEPDRKLEHKTRIDADRPATLVPSE